MLTALPAEDFPPRLDAVPGLGTQGALTQLWDHLKVSHKQRAYGWFQRWADTEAAASVLRSYEPLIVPGLLQTEDYARAMTYLETSAEGRSPTVPPWPRMSPCASINSGQKPCRGVHQESGRGTMDMTGAGWRTNGGNCVEVGALARAVAVRDSQDRGGPQLAFAPGTWTASTEQLKAVA